jgi:hypothetical protein
LLRKKEKGEIIKGKEREEEKRLGRTDGNGAEERG